MCDPEEKPGHRRNAGLPRNPAPLIRLPCVVPHSRTAKIGNLSGTKWFSPRSRFEVKCGGKRLPQNEYSVKIPLQIFHRKRAASRIAARRPEFSRPHRLEKPVFAQTAPPSASPPPTARDDRTCRAREPSATGEKSKESQKRKEASNPHPGGLPPRFPAPGPRLSTAWSCPKSRKRRPIGPKNLWKTVESCARNGRPYRRREPAASGKLVPRHGLPAVRCRIRD